MENRGSIIVTGACGFIGSVVTRFLNESGYSNLILVDNFTRPDKEANWKNKTFLLNVERDNLFSWLQTNPTPIDLVIHLGARTDTTEFDYAVHQALNVDYSIKVWNFCVEKRIPLIYASSAATYGSGELGYNDDHKTPFQLKPLNPYGVSKNEFDKWALQQQTRPPFWTGLKFFNVYGPNEYHKNRMASVILHAVKQIKETGTVKLFKSHKEGVKDGEQLRDFVYVMDLAKIILWMSGRMLNEDWNDTLNGLYNLGTGKARSFYDLVVATFKGMEKHPSISFVDMPIDIRDKYQYFTEANITKLRDAGYLTEFYSLEDGVVDYVKNYLLNSQYY